MSSSSVFEVLECGPILAGSAELGWLITGNGAYLNLWVSVGDGQWSNTDCRARPKDMWSTSAADLWDEGKAWLQELEAGPPEEE